MAYAGQSRLRSLFVQQLHIADKLIRIRRLIVFIVKLRRHHTGQGCARFPENSHHIRPDHILEKTFHGLAVTFHKHLFILVRHARIIGIDKGLCIDHGINPVRLHFGGHGRQDPQPRRILHIGAVDGKHRGSFRLSPPDHSRKCLFLDSLITQGFFLRDSVHVQFRLRDQLIPGKGKFQTFLRALCRIDLLSSQQKPSMQMQIRHRHLFGSDRPDPQKLLQPLIFFDYGYIRQIAEDQMDSRL